MKHLTTIVMNKSRSTYVWYNNKEATIVNTEGLEESLITIVKMDIYDWWMTTSQKIQYTQRLNSDVGSECSDNCSIQLSMLLVIMMNIYKWDLMLLVEWVSNHCRSALQLFVYWYTNHMLIVWMIMLELVNAWQLNAYKNL